MVEEGTLVLRPCESRAAHASGKSSKEEGVVEEGKPPPDFELVADSDDRIKLSNLQGKPGVLHFYPKDDTPALLRSKPLAVSGFFPGAAGSSSRAANGTGRGCSRADHAPTHGRPKVGNYERPATRLSWAA